MSNTVIEVKGLRKSFPTADVLRGIDMEVKAGEVIGYLGSNGAGKTTTVKILCGMIRAFLGEVNILGYDLRKEDVKIKLHIGYVPEQAVMYEQLTPVEYLELVGTLYEMKPEKIKEETRKYLELFEMTAEADRRMFNFSKGMKQKIHLISGLIHDPDIVFLDEPLNGLDANAVIVVKNLISRLAAEGKTVFYCSHLMDVVEKVATRVLLLNEGRVIADGSVEELKTAYGVASLETLFTRLTGKNEFSEKEICS